MPNFLHNAHDTFNSDFSSSVYKSNSLSSFSQHFHKNFEIIFVTQGNCVCTLNNQQYTLSKGQAIFICPFQIHNFSLGTDSEIRRITFHQHLILTVSQTLNGRVPKNPVFCISKELLDLTLQKIHTFWGNENVSLSRIAPYERRIYIKGLLYMICGEFLDQAVLTEITHSNKIAIDVVQYISENFQKNISLSEIAKEKGYNPQYISRTFNTTMGLSFKKILNQFRLEHAYAMLQDTDMPISYICFESGFQSIRSFNQECKDTFGKTPKELRISRTWIKS